MTILHVDWPKCVKVEERLSVEESILAYFTFLEGVCKTASKSFAALKSTSLDLIGLVTSLGADTDDLSLCLMLLEQVLGLSDLVSSNDSSSLWGKSEYLFEHNFGDLVGLGIWHMWWGSHGIIWIPPYLSMS